MEDEVDVGADAALFSELLGALPATGESQTGFQASAELQGSNEAFQLAPESGRGEEESELLCGDVGLLDALCAPLMAFDDGLLADELDISGASSRGECGGDNSAIEESAVSHVASSCGQRPSRARGKQRAAKPAPRRSNPNKAREEQRRELLTLRSQVTALEEQIEGMKAAACGLATPHALESRREELAGHHLATAATEADKVEGHVEFTDVWRQMCLRQLNRRIEAERENARLRDAVSRRAQVTAAIQTLLETPLSPKDIPDVLSRKRLRSPRVPPTDPECDREIFMQLSADVDAAVAKIDKFLEDNGLLNDDTSRHGTQIREVDGGVVLDVFATSVLPFDWKRASSGAWHFYKGFQKHFGPVHDKIAQSIGTGEDVVMESFIIEITASNATADFRVRQVIKRFMQKQQQVIVWRNDCQPVEYVNQTTNFGFRETGFVVCRPPRDQSRADNCTTPVSILQAGYRISPYMATTSQTGRQLSLRANITDIAQFVFSSLHVEIRAKINRIEDLLINEHRNGSDCIAEVILQKCTGHLTSGTTSNTQTLGRVEEAQDVSHERPRKREAK